MSEIAAIRMRGLCRAQKRYLRNPAVALRRRRTLLARRVRKSAGRFAWRPRPSNWNRARARTSSDAVEWARRDAKLRDDQASRSPYGARGHTADRPRPILPCARRDVFLQEWMRRQWKRCVRRL